MYANCGCTVPARNAGAAPFTANNDAVHGIYGRPSRAARNVAEQVAQWRNNSARTRFVDAVKEFGDAESVENQRGGAASWTDRAMYARIVVRDANDGSSVTASLSDVRLPPAGVAEIAALNRALAGSRAQLTYDAASGTLTASGRSMAHVACLLKVAVDVALDDTLSLSEARQCLERMAVDAERDDQVYCEICSALEDDMREARATAEVERTLTSADREALDAARTAAAAEANQMNTNVERVVNAAVNAAQQRNAANGRNQANGSEVATAVLAAVEQGQAATARIAVNVAESSGVKLASSLDAAYRAAMSKAQQGAAPLDVIGAALQAAGREALAPPAESVAEAQQAMVDAGNEAAMRVAMAAART